MRERDPRRVFRRHREARARVQIIETPKGTTAPDRSVTTKQVAAVTLPRSELDRIWNAEYLERLARTYWSFLTRVSLGILRVLYRPDSRGIVAWRINRGLLVAPKGRGKGFLRLTVERLPPPAGASGRQVNLVVSSEVANFYPTIGGWGWFTAIGRYL